MAVRRAGAVVLAVLAGILSALPGQVGPARAAEYILESRALYQIRPDEGEIGVRIDLDFTNTTPDPEGQFSVFTELKLAIHDEAAGVTARDGEGDLDVSVDVENGVNVATVELRDDLRFEDETSLQVRYTLPDSDDPHLRVRSSVVVFPAWSFGTAGEVRVTIPVGYEIRVDGDPLTEEGDWLSSGRIDDPSEWLALVTAVQPAEYAAFEAIVPLDGGTADLLVRAFADDEAWGERTLGIVERSLARIEEEVGLPYPRLGQLILTEVVSIDSTGLAENESGQTEFMVAYDQPPFTALHQVTHVWLSPDLIESRWIREGIASQIAARVGGEIDVDPPYDPEVEADEQSGAAIPLDIWSAGAPPESEAFGYAASWDTVRQLEAVVGADGMRTVLGRVAAAIGPYESGEVEPEPDATPGREPVTPLTSRGFLDHLETVSGVDLADLFAQRVLTEADVALLDARRAARDAFEELAGAADGWPAPDPVRAALVAWSFDDALERIAEADAWIEQRDVLLAQMQGAGLSAPDRLKLAYRAYGGGPEAVSELDAERSVVSEYVSTADSVNAERSLLERIGLLGGPDPHAQLNLASGRFADGDLRGAIDAVAEAQRIVAAAETGGLVRLASILLLMAILVAAAVVLFRRRASYTSAP